MFSFNFASKMLNTIMGTDEEQAQQQQQQQQQGGGGGPNQMGGGGPQQGQGGMRPQGGFPPGGMRPPGGGGQVGGPGGGGGSPRPGFPGPPTFSGPRPSPGARAGPPSFGGPARPMGAAGVGQPHRFNGPQPPQQQQLPPGQQQPPGPGPGPGQQQMNRGMSPMSPSPNRAQSPGGPRPRGPGPGGQMMMGGPHGGPMNAPGPHPFPTRPAGVAAPSAAAPVPDVDLSHLSAEERAMIENVMAKAQQLEQHGPPPPLAPPSGLSISQQGVQQQMHQPLPPQQLQQHPPQQQQRMMRPEAQHTAGMDFGGGVKMCPLCRQRDVSGKMDGIPGQECAECRLVVCNRCGGMSAHPETKRPEWSCGNCINNRRQRMGQLPPHGTSPGHHPQPQQGLPSQRPYGPQAPSGVDPEAGRRGSGGGMQQPSQLQQQQIEREFDQIESKEKMRESWGGGGTDPAIVHRRRPSFEEIFSPPEKIEHSQEPLPESPVDIDFSYPSDPPSFPDHSQCMSTPHTASASQAKPSFVNTNNKLHSRSVSIDMAERQDPTGNSGVGGVSSGIGSGIGSGGGGILSPPQNGYDYYTMEHLRETPIDDDEQPCTSSSSYVQQPLPPPSLPPQPPPVDEKASALMEELSRLQSAVDTTLKRRQEQRQQEPVQGIRFQPIRSPSPSPSPIGSPFESPMVSPTRKFKSHHHHDNKAGSPPESPDDVPGPRKAIVLKEHDLDDYKSSSEEESVESDDSDEGRKRGPTSGDVYYDHSPGEVYTIPEEEDEGGSPTGGDLVTSLKHQGIGFTPNVPGGDLGLGAPRGRRGVGQDMGMLNMGVVDPRQPQRPQLRPQRSLDNRLPSSSATQPHPDMSTHQSMDQQGNVYATNNNINTQSVAQHPGLGPLDNQGVVNQDIMGTSMSHQLTTSSQPSAMGGGGSATTSAAAIHGQHPPASSAPDHYYHQQQQQQSELQQLQQVLHQQQALQHPQQPMFGSTMSDSQLSLDPSQRSIQQPQQLGQRIPDTSQGVGTGTNEWNVISGQPSMMGPTASVAGPSTDQSSLMQSYHPQQQQQQLPPTTTSSFSPHPTSSPIPSQTASTNLHQPQPQQFQPLQGQFQPLQQTTVSQQGPQQPLTSFPQQQGAHLQGLQQQQQPFQSLAHQPMQTQQAQQQPSHTQPNKAFQDQIGIHPQQQQQQGGLPISSQSMSIHPQSSTTTTTLSSGGPLQGSQLQQLQAQQVQAQQLAQQQSWLQQVDQQQQQQQQQQNLYDQQTGRLTTTQQQQYPQSQSPLPGQQQPGLLQGQQTDAYQQSMQQLMQQQTNAQGMQQLGGTSTSLVPGHGSVVTSQAGPGAKSISGLLADFSRALGLGSSPRPSPSEDKSLAFPIPNTGQPLSPYDSYQSQSGVPQSIPHQQSAFASIHDPYQRQNQQLPYLSHSPQSGLPSQFGQGSSQQYGSTSPQPCHIVSQASLQQQQQSGSVGVMGALSPAQAHMYQQQMAMQHQQQHMKKRSRGGQIGSAGEMRRDMTSGQQGTLLIGSQGLAVTPGGMTIPTVVTSMGTFIGGGPTILGTQLIQQPMAGTLGGYGGGGGWTPVGTPRSGREPPGAGDSSDTMSETDSQKSLRMRRKLPCLPPDQEAAPLPSTKKRDRHRSHEHFRSVSPLRMQSGADGILTSRQYPFSSLSLSRPSASESNLRKISMNVSDQVPRPGSALGLLQASSVVSSMGGKPDVAYPMNMSRSLFSTSTTFPGMRPGLGYPSDLTTQTTSVLAGLYPSHKTTQDSWNANLAELAACLPPDLRHLLNKGPGSIEHELSNLSGISGLGDSSINSGSQLPSYIRSLREQLQEERRQLLSEERRRLELLRERDRELGARLDAVTSRAGSESGIRSRTDLGISRSAGASPNPLLSRKLKSHRRQLSDPKLSIPFSPIQEDGDSELQDFDRVSASLLRPPYKSYEYESLEDSELLRQRSSEPHFDWDHSQSYLASSWASAGGVLRETAINSMGLAAAAGVTSSELQLQHHHPLHHHHEQQLRSAGIPSRYLSRRNSEGETLSSSRMSSTSRRHQLRKHRKSRSWHPSPYQSQSEEEEEEEEDMLSREEKKARIKAEIARRRQQMQERSGGGGGGGGGGIRSDLSRFRDPIDHEKHSVLKSVDQLIRDQYGRYEAPSTYGRFLMYSGGGVGGGPGTTSGGGGSLGRIHHGPHGTAIVSPSASEEDRSIERIASTFKVSASLLRPPYKSYEYESLEDSDHLHHHHHHHRSSDSQRIPSTFRSDELYYEMLGQMSPMATDESESMCSELGAPLAMPILPDMPTRLRMSRRLLEDLGSAPIGLGGGDASGVRGAGSSSVGVGGGGQMMKGRRQSLQNEPPQPRRLPPPAARLQGDRSSTGSTATFQGSWHPDATGTGHHPPRPRPMHKPVKGKTKDSSNKNSALISVDNFPSQQGGGGGQAKKSQSSTTSRRKPMKEYLCPIKRFVITRDLKDSSIESNGIGVKVVGGKEMPDSTGRLAAYIAKVFPEKLGNLASDIYEGDVVLEWNGNWLENKTFEEVSSVIQADSSSKEVELVIRSDYNILTGKPRLDEDDFPSELKHGGRRRRRPNPESPQDQDDSSHDGRDEPQRSFMEESSQNIPEDFRHYSQSTGHEMNSRSQSVAGSRLRLVRSPSQSSTEATNTSASTSVRGPLIEDSGTIRFPQHLIIPSESDLRKRSTTSLPPSLTDANEHLLHLSRDRCNRKGSENISVKSMGLSSSPEKNSERKSHHPGPSRGKKGSYGQIQLQICHDPRANILYVTVLRARLHAAAKQQQQRVEDENVDNPNNVGAGVDHPYVIVFLLPDPLHENQRRTRHIMTTNICPTWNQTMVYPNVTAADLKDQYLEVAVRNYNPNGVDGLLGKIILYLSDEGILDEQPHSYSLRLEEKPYRQSHVKYSKSPRCSGTGSRRTSGDTGDPEDEAES